MVPKALFLTSIWPSCSHMGHMSYVDLPALPPTQGYPRIPKDTKPPSIVRPDEKHMIHISRSQKRKTEYHIHKTPITMVYIYMWYSVYIYIMIYLYLLWFIFYIIHIILSIYQCGFDHQKPLDLFVVVPVGSQRESDVFPFRNSLRRTGIYTNDH